MSYFRHCATGEGLAHLQANPAMFLFLIGLLIGVLGMFLLYYRARRGTAERFRRFVRPDQKVVAIGDALRAGKSKEAIASAFEAALLGAPAGTDHADQPATLP